MFFQQGMAYTNTSPMLVPTRAKSVSGNTNRMARHERKKIPCKAIRIA